MSRAASARHASRPAGRAAPLGAVAPARGLAETPRSHSSILGSQKIQKFRFEVWKHWRGNGRHDLPWRKTKSPYRILVSEVMLQQTQVPRVIEKYKEFLKVFPNVRALAKAPLVDVLRMWSGLGYNRRGKYLHDAAKIIVEKRGGKVSRDFAALRALPGIGPYTASAIRVFVYNESDILIETNIRTALLHHFFPRKKNITDKELLTLARRVAERQDPRKWHSALMDYGVYLKRSGVRNNARSAHYTKQSKFEGSLRQVRGAILRELHQAPRTTMRLNLIGFPRGKVRGALEGLVEDGLIREARRPPAGRQGLIVKQKERWRIA